VPFQLQLPRGANSKAAATASCAQLHLGPGCYDPSYSLVQPALARLLLPFQAGSSSSSSGPAFETASAGNAELQQPREGDVLDLDVDAALQVVLPSKAVHSTVHMRLMLGREQTAAALSAMAAAAAAAAAGGGGFGGASGLGLGKLTSQLPLPDADLDAALRRRLPDVTGFVSNSPGHAGEQGPLHGSACEQLMPMFEG
jgi:hypothetical protein